MSSSFLNLPSNHPVPPTTALYVRALYDYESNSSSSISFRAGDLIRVLNRLDSGWWDGILDDVRGWFPSNYTVIVAEDSIDPEDDDIHRQSLTGYSQHDQSHEEDEAESQDTAAASQDDTRRGPKHHISRHDCQQKEWEIQRGHQEREHRRRRSQVLGEESTLQNEVEQAKEEQQEEHGKHHCQNQHQHQHQHQQKEQQQQHDRDHGQQLGSSGAVDREQASWVPQLTQQGQLFYFNHLTGKSTVDLNPDGLAPSLSSASKTDRNTITPASAAAAAFLQKQQSIDTSRAVGHTPSGSTSSNRFPLDLIAQGIDHDEAADGANRAQADENSILNPNTAHFIPSNSSTATSSSGMNGESTLLGNTTITPATARPPTAVTIAAASAASGNGNGSSGKASIATTDTIHQPESVKGVRPAATTDWITSSESTSTTSSSSENGRTSPQARQVLATERGYALEGLRSQVTVVPETKSAATTTRATHMGANTAGALRSPNGSRTSLDFLPDTHLAIRPTWQSILVYTRSAVAQYRLAVKSRKLHLYIPLVENISDQLRLLLAAASDTTDNHSGTPSVISGNKELSPEFRNMMSRFSKMVVNSHLAISAAEWIGRPSASSLPIEDGIGNGSVGGTSVEASNAQPLLDAEMKCITESHGFEEAMERFIEKARELRGEQVVQLIPAFIAGSNKAGSGICVGGNWSGNGVFHERRGGATRPRSTIRERKLNGKERRREKEVATSAFLELVDDDDDDDDDDAGNTSSADKENSTSVPDGHAAAHGTDYESHGDDGDASRGEDTLHDESSQRESSSDDHCCDHEYTESGDLDSHFDSLTEDDDDSDGFDDGYGFADDDDDDDDESSDLGLELGGYTSSADSIDRDVMPGSENRRPTRYNACNRPRPNRTYSNDTADESESVTMGMDVVGKTRHPCCSHHDDYDTDASLASVAATATAAADTAVRNRMGRSRSRTNTLGGQVASRVNIPAPITVFGGRSTSGSKNRDTMIIEGHADQDHDVDSAATDGEVNLLAAKKLSSRMAGPRSTRGRGPIRSRRVCPRPRLRLTPRSLQKFTPLRTNLESALRKLDTSTVTGCEGISGTSNRVSTGVPPKPSSRTGNDEGDLGSGMASPSLTMTSSMSSMSLLNSLSTHTPMTLTIAGRDALADRVCAAAAEALKSFQPLAKLLESFNLKGLVDDAFLESLHGGVGAPGGGSTASVRTVPESNSGSSPGSSNGNPPSGNAFANIEKPAAPRMVIGEDAFGNPILGQSTGTSTPTAMSHQFSYSHSSSVQSPSFISPSESSVSLSVPFGEPGPSNLLPSPAPGMAGSNKTQVRPLTQAEALANAFAYKQRLYDAIGALVLAAQAIGAPLADEWSTVSEETLSQDASAGDSPIRGTSLEAMDSRIGMLRGTVGMVKGILEQLSIALQILLEFEIPSEQARRRTLVVRREGMTHSPGGRNSSAVRNRRASGSVDMRMESFAESAESKGARKVRVMQMNVQPRMDKANRFFGEPTPTTASHDSAGLAGANKDHHSSQVPPLSLSGSAGISGGFNGGSVASPTHITPWFLRCDHEAEVVYEEKDGIIMLKAGSLLGLVEQLTRHDKLDTSFHSTFLLTYRSFTTATELFEHLMHRFTLPPPLGLLDEAEHALWTRMKQGPIRIRVVNTLKTWLENYWMEPNDDCEDGPTSRLLRNIQTFVQNAVFPTKTPGASQLLTLVEKRLQMGLEGKDQQVAMGRKMTPHIKSAPTPLWPKNTKRVKLLDINPEEMARQLSLIEIRLYARIKPTECLNKTWTKKSKNPDDTHNCAPNVKAMIRHSNQLTNWVAETILRQGDVKRRVAVIKFFTNVADRCGKMNNYSSLMTIISALATAPIDRLGRTWCQVSARTMATLERLRTLMQTTKNFALYRQTLHNVNPPCIPFLGIYLTDLIFTEDGIPSTADNSMINFSKWRKTAAVIQEIQQFQNGTYQFQPVPELQEWILQQMREAQDCSTKAAYDRSLEIEPREREDEKITRLLSESGFL